jgi:signal transduction histidine kinase
VTDPPPLARPSPGDLRAVALFAGLSGDQIDWLAAHGEVVRLARGERAFEMGERAHHLFVVLEGVLQLEAPHEGALVPVAVHRAGSATGMLPYSRMTTYAGRGVAVEPCRLARFSATDFPDLLQRIPELGSRLVSTMADRVREATRLAQQREKMAALGKVAAGLAHELNNPATAIGRAGEALRTRLAQLAEVEAALVESGTPGHALREAAEVLAALGTGRPAALGSLERASREDALAAWLETRGVDDATEIAASLVDAGASLETLSAAVERTPGVGSAAVLRWLSLHASAGGLVDEIAEAASRVSALVGSVKTYSHMDRAAGREAVDVRAGLESTLVMLGHRLRARRIVVERQFAPDLPRVQGYAGALNQVWTNLIDNAIDAVEEGGGLRVEAAVEGGSLAVRVIDRGTGIPDGIQSRIFEPFFTTKDVGLGTGLGLDLVQQIVTEQHGGRIALESRPGRTVFTVFLPLRSDARQGSDV